jgi:hypothetical protein
MKLTYALCGAALVIAAPTLAASLFDGTWKADVSTAKPPTKPDVLLLKGGNYSCSSCAPPLEVKADGAFHVVTGRSYSDEVSVKVDGPHTITETSKFKGKIVYSETFTVAPDGKTATLAFVDTSAPDGKPVKGEVKEKRVADAPAGAHAVSGSWLITGFSDYSDAGVTTTYALVGDTLMMKTPNGFGYSAKLGGPAVPIKGDNAGAMAAVRKIDANTLEETDTVKGKIVSVTTMSVQPGGKVMKVDVDDRKQGSKMSFTMTRQ